MPQQQREGIKTYVVNLVIKVSSDPKNLKEQKLFLSKANKVLVEVCAALVRHANTNKSQRSGVLSLLTEFALTIDRREFEVHAPSLTLPFKAATLAIDLGHPLKDCIYLALAMEQACLLVTADARFAAKAETVFQNIGLLDDF